MPRENVNDLAILGGIVDSVGQCRTLANWSAMATRPRRVWTRRMRPALARLPTSASARDPRSRGPCAGWGQSAQAVSSAQ